MNAKILLQKQDLNGMIEKICSNSRGHMKISYKRLWKLLIDREMLKKDLAKKADISTTSIAKLGKNER